MSTTNDEKRECPQCDGAGQEEMGITPIVCRKCGGTGAIATIHKVAAFMCGGDVLEKTAQSEFEDDQPTEPDDNEFVGTGYDELALIPKSTSDGEVKLGIISLLTEMSPDHMSQMFDRIFAVIGGNADEARNSVTDGSGKPDEFKINEYIFAALDRMDAKQLRAVFCEARRIG